MRWRRFVEIQCVLFCLKYCIIFETNSNVVELRELELQWSWKMQELQKAGKRKSWKKKKKPMAATPPQAQKEKKKKKEEKENKKKQNKKRELLLRT